MHELIVHTLGAYTYEVHDVNINEIWLIDDVNLVKMLCSEDQGGYQVILNIYA